MKKLMIILATTVFVSTAFAHSGGTDKYGCHTKHSNGTYHCH